MSNELQPTNVSEEATGEIEQEVETSTAETTLQLPNVIKITKIIAWVVLIGGIIGALEIYSSIALITSNGDLLPSDLTAHSPSVYHPYGLTLAVGVLVSAIIAWAVLSLQALNSENLFYIRYDLYYKKSE